MAIFTGLVVGKFPKRTSFLVLGLIIVLSLPSNINTLNGYINKYINEKALLISNDNVEALNYLKSVSKTETVLTGYYNNAYIPAISGLPTYYADEDQASILLLDHKTRSQITARYMVECKDEPELDAFVSDNQISYIYFDKTKYPDCLDKYVTYPSLNSVFKNNSVEILKHK